VTQGPVRVPLSGKRIQTLYDSMSSIYDLLTRYERGSLKKALEIANPRENLLILEAGFGTGRTLVELAKKVGDTGEVYALDVSRTMTNRTHRILHRCNLSHRVNLVIGDARHTPFCDTVFDLVFSSYMLDLIDSDAIPRVLSEFKRLLKSTVVWRMQTGPAGAIPSGTWIQEREQKVHAGRAFDADRDCLGEQGQISSLVSLCASSFSFDLCASLGAAVVAWTVVGSSCVWVSWCVRPDLYRRPSFMDWYCVHHLVRASEFDPLILSGCLVMVQTS
jgi:SAM-dependent methyltransferase